MSSLLDAAVVWAYVDVCQNFSYLFLRIGVLCIYNLCSSVLLFRRYITSYLLLGTTFLCSSFYPLYAI